MVWSGWGNAGEKDMTKFIRLTDYFFGGASVYVDSSKVVSVQWHSDHSLVTLLGEYQKLTYQVTESAEQIMDLIVDK